MQYEADTIQEEYTRLLDQAKMIQKENSDITCDIYNMVANHVRTEENIIKLYTMASENIKSIEKTRKKNDKYMTEKADIESKLNRFFLDK